MHIALSTLCIPLAKYAATIMAAADAKIDRISVDIVDGSMQGCHGIIDGSPKLVAWTKDLVPDTWVEVHLMVENVTEKLLEDLREARTDEVIVPANNRTEVYDVKTILDLGMKAGIFFGPKQKLHNLDHLSGMLSQVMLVTAQLGQAGGRIVDDIAPRARWLIQEKAKGGHDYKLSGDGGIKEANIRQFFGWGFQIVSAGSCVAGFPKVDPGKVGDNLEQLRKELRP